MPSADRDGWIVIADSPFLPARGGGQAEHAGFAASAGRRQLISTLVVPHYTEFDVRPYEELCGGAKVVRSVRSQRVKAACQAWHSLGVASRPAVYESGFDPKDLTQASGIVLFSYKSYRIARDIQNALGLPVVLRAHNLEGDYHRALADETDGLAKVASRADARRVLREERWLERSLLLRHIFDISKLDAEIRSARSGVPVSTVGPFAAGNLCAGPVRAPRADSLLFVGALDVALNRAALSWLISNVVPVVHHRFPDARLTVIGSRCSADYARSLARHRYLDLVQDVADVGAVLRESAVALNPMRSGSGVNIKLVEYLMAGVPSVATRRSVQALGDEFLPLVPTADEPIEFAEQVCSILADPETAQQRADRAMARCSAVLDSSVALARFQQALSSP